METVIIFLKNGKVLKKRWSHHHNLLRKTMEKPKWGKGGLQIRE